MNRTSKFKKLWKKYISLNTELTPIKETRTLYEYDVKEDITAYELFRIKPIPPVYREASETSDQSFDRLYKWYNDLPETCKRHLKEYQAEIIVDYEEYEDYRKGN